MYSLLLLKNGTPIITFSLDGNTTIGRSSKCEVQIIDTHFSRRHALIQTKNEQYWLEDLGSQNGTYYEGLPIKQPVLLSDNSEIRIGQHAFIFNPSVDIIHGHQNKQNVLLVDDTQLTDAATLDVNQREQLQIDSWKFLHQLTIELLASVDLNGLLQTLLNHLRTQFSAKRGFILLRNHSKEKFRAAAVHSDSCSMGISRALLERVVGSKTPLMLNNAIENISFVGAKSIVEHNLRSVMIVPLIENRNVIGIIQLDSSTPNFYSQNSLARLSLIADTVSAAIKTTRRAEIAKKKLETISNQEFSQTEFIGETTGISELLERTKRAAASDSKVLIEGESGTGKELIAKMIHEASPRNEGPWIALNCAAIPETLLESELFGYEKGAFTGATKRKAGCFELADGGTLFLDEIGELSATTQVKLLRVLQEQCFYRLGSNRPTQVNVRVVGATNRDLAACVASGEFREDLYFRLNVISLRIPPLRNRREDIPALATFFLHKFSRKMGKVAPQLSHEAIRALENHHWPGNVRELQNTMERVLVFCDNLQIASSDLVLGNTTKSLGTPVATGNLSEVLKETEKQMIHEALTQTNGRKAAACKILGISRPTLDKKIAAYGMPR